MPVDLWTSPSFVEEATAWSAAAAADRGLTLTGEWEQPHARPWSSAIRLRDRRRPAVVQGERPRHRPRGRPHRRPRRRGTRPRARGAGARRRPRLVADARRRAGAARPSPGRTSCGSSWHTVITAYARAQRTLAGHLDALRASGVREVSPATLPAPGPRRSSRELAARPVDEGGLEAEQADRLAALLPAYDGWCAELAASGVPMSINHDDLHAGNICWDGDGPRIIDWGDAVLGHPFGTLLAPPTRSPGRRASRIDDPRVVAVRDAYLDEFADVGTRERPGPLDAAGPPYRLRLPGAVLRAGVRGRGRRGAGGDGLARPRLVPRAAGGGRLAWAPWNRCTRSVTMPSATWTRWGWSRPCTPAGCRCPR